MRAIPITFINVFFVCMILLLACMFAFLSKYSKTMLQTRLYLVLAFSVLILFATFRGDIGTDTLQYRNTFDNGMLNQLQGELGYYLIIRISRILGSFKYELFLFSIISHFFVYKIIISNHKQINIFTAFITYICLFYFNSFNIMRQFLAICIITFAIDNLLKDKNVKKYIIFILLASSFHLTAAFAGFIGIFIYLYKYNQLKYIFNKKVLIILIIVFLLFFRNIVNIISSIDLFSKYGKYMAEEINYHGNNIVLNTFITLAWISFLRFILRNKFDVYIVFLIIELGLQSLGIYSIYLKRMALYFSQYQIITYSYYTKELSKKKYRIFIFANYLYLVLQLCISIMIGTGGVFA